MRWWSRSNSGSFSFLADSTGSLSSLPTKWWNVAKNQTLIFVLHLFSQNRFLRVFHHKDKSSVQLYLKQMSTAAKSKSWNGAILEFLTSTPEFLTKQGPTGDTATLSLSLSLHRLPNESISSAELKAYCDITIYVLDVFLSCSIYLYVFKFLTAGTICNTVPLS